MSFLPGWFPGAAGAGGAAGLTTLTQVGSGTAVGATGAITSSVTIAAGDLLVVWGYAVGLTSQSPPPSFTNILTSLDDANNLCAAYYKIATGSEGTSVTGLSATGTAQNAFNTLYVFRGNVPITTVTPASINAPGQTANNPGAQTVTASSGAPPLIVLGFYGIGLIDPRTFSPAKDGEIEATNGVNTDVWLAYKIYNSSPANVSIDMDDEGATNNLASCYLECA